MSGLQPSKLESVSNLPDYEMGKENVLVSVVISFKSIYLLLLILQLVTLKQDIHNKLFKRLFKEKIKTSLKMRILSILGICRSLCWNLRVK